MKLIMEEAKETLCLPADAIIQVLCLDVQAREVEGRNNKPNWTKLDFTFEIIGLPTVLEDQYGHLVGQKIFGGMGANLTNNPDNKLRQWVIALTGLNEIEPGFELDTDILTNRRARAVVENYTKTGQTLPYHKVGGLLPASGAAPTPTAGLVSASSLIPASSSVQPSLDDEPPF